MYAKAAKAHLKKNVDHLLTSKPGLAHSVLKKLRARPSEDTDGNGFQLQEFMNRDLTCDQIANEIGDYFSIFQEFQPVDTERLPVEVRECLQNVLLGDVPAISLDDVYALPSKTNTKG